MTNQHGSGAAFDEIIDNVFENHQNNDELSREYDFMEAFDPVSNSTLDSSVETNNGNATAGTKPNEKTDSLVIVHAENNHPTHNQNYDELENAVDLPAPNELIENNGNY